MVNIKIRESLLKMIDGKLLGLKSCDDELSEVNFPRSIGINDSNKKLDFFLSELFFFEQRFFELICRDNAIMIMI